MSQEILTELWRKYMFITAISGVTTAGDYSIGVIRKNRDTIELLERVLFEMKKLANSYGIGLNDSDVEQALTQIAGLPEEATSSMHQDKRKGVPLEVEHLHGGAIRLALEKQLDVPHIYTLYSLIKPHENI
jgi:2-dehydropantoate 2-reductase